MFKPINFPVNMHHDAEFAQSTVIQFQIRKGFHWGGGADRLECSLLSQT